MTVDDEYPIYTEEQLEQANKEAERIGINIDVFVQKRLGIALGTMNRAAMTKLIELLKGVS